MMRAVGGSTWENNKTKIDSFWGGLKHEISTVFKPRQISDGG